MKKIDDVVLASLVADSYSLGAHWIYSQDKLSKSDLDWNALNAPLAMWHDTKKKGDFTHYGDQLVCLYDHVSQSERFVSSDYMVVWENYMRNYTGYVDGATRETLQNLDNHQSLPCGSSSDDLSIIGRIAPLLLVSVDEESFLSNTQQFIRLTHDNTYLLEVGHFIAKLLFQTYHDDKPIITTIEALNSSYSDRVQKAIQKGLQSSQDATLSTIESFGPACSVEGGFESVIHSLTKYENDLKQALTQNAKAGGDSSARGMIIAMIMVASYSGEIIPSDWVEQMNYRV